MSDFARLFALLFCVFLLAGCGFHIGPDGLSLVVAGTFYTHSDEQIDTGNGDGEKDAPPGVSQWRTSALRTMGTSGIEGKITSDSETISIQGDGMSKEMSATLGDDVISTVADQVSCALQPAQPKCLGGVKSTAGAALKAVKKVLVVDEPNE